MKTNFTHTKKNTFTLIIAFFCCSLQLKADDENPVYNFSFNTVPQLLSGINLSVGAKYKFSNVASGTSAVITIVSATGGATVVILDDNNLTKPEAFSPQISVPAGSTGMVEFKIEFFNGNSNNPKILQQFSATAMDIDGSANLHEMDALNMGAGAILSYFSQTLEINVTQTGNEYLATNIAGNEYTGVDTAAKQVMFTLTNNNISSFTYKAGVNNQVAGLVSRQKGIYFKGFNYASLAVKYISFSAVTVNKAVVLNWATAQEIDNNYFEVERSFNGKDFEVIGQVNNGSTTGKAYQFTDNDALVQTKTVVYYRLKQVDKDGKANYTTILVVRLQANNNVVMQTAPNPFTESVNISFAALVSGSAQIEILNSNGQKVIVTQTKVTKGNNNLQVNGLSKITNGMYVARLIMNGTIIGNQKIIKN